MSNQSVLILLATHNGESYIRPMIDSVLAQDHADLRIIVSDDNSTDGTPAILTEYANTHPDKITHYRSDKRFGSAQKHFMHLLEQFHDQPYIMFCDQDDVWHTDKVEKTLAATERKSGKKMKRLNPMTNFPVSTNNVIHAPDLILP